MGTKVDLPDPILGHRPQGQRVLASGVLAPAQQARLAALCAKTNPRQLREDIYRAVEQLWQHADQGKETAVPR